MEEENNNIYLMDKPIDNIDKDEFDNKSIVDEIVNNIESNEPPYNIALIGKWGTGKSSILDCAKKQLDEKNKNKYVFANINAWKYEKQEIRKAFILEILERIPEKDENTLNGINEIVKALNNIFIISQKEVEEDKKIKWYKILWNIVKKAVVLILPLILMFLFSFFIIDTVLNLAGKTIEGYNYIRLEQICAFIMTILAEIGIIIKNNVYGKKPVNIYLEETEKDTSFYEKQLENAINLYKEKNTNFKSIICVVEDIDRLNAGKMVEAISALKSFVGFENLIFIVPYDTNILCKVLEECKVNKLSSNYEILEGELILNKLFQFKIYMPELIQEDMYEYAKNLIEKENNKIYRLFPTKEVLLDGILPILMYDGVNTPREAKQLINSFITKYNIAISRGVIEYENYNNNDVKALALLTVLENDFNEFYSKIILYPNIIKEFIKIEGSGKTTLEIQEIFKNLNEEIYKGKKMKELLSFLKFTTTINTDNIERLIYLNDSKIDKVSGGKVARDFREALRNCEYKKAIEFIDNIKDISDVISREISYNSSNLLRKKNIIISLVQIYNKFSNLNEEDRKSIRGIIENNILILSNEEYVKLNIVRLIEVVADNSLKNCKNIIDILKIKLDEWKPVYFYYEDETGFVENDKDCIEEELEKIINIYSDIDQEGKEKIKRIFNSIGNYSRSKEDAENSYNIYNFKDLFNFIKPKLDSKVFEILGNEFLQKVINNVKNEKMEINDLEKFKDIYVENNDIESFSKLILDSFKNEKAQVILNILEFIKSYIEKLSNGMKKQIFKLVEDNLKELCELDDITELDEILSFIIVDVFKEDDNNDVDALLKALNEKIYITKIINKLANNNLLDRIPNTIEQINEELIDKNNEYFDMFERIHKKYTVEYKEDLFNKLHKNLPNYKENIDIIRDKFRILKSDKNNIEICKNFIEKIENYIKKNLNNFTNKNKRVEILKFCTENMNLLDKEKIDEFFEFINEKVYSIDVYLSIELLNYPVFNNVEDEKWKDILEKYLNSTKLKVIEYVDIILKKINILIADESMKNKYINNLINDFENDTRILKSIVSLMIIDIDNIVKVYEQMENFNTDVNVVETFRNIMENINNVEELIQKILDKKLELNLLIIALKDSKKINFNDSIKKVLNTYRDDKEKETQDYRIGLLELISNANNSRRYFKNDFVEILIDILNRLEEKDVKKVVNKMIANKDKIDKESKKIILSKLEVTIEKMNDEEKTEIKSLLENY